MSLLGCSKDWLELDQPGNIDKPYFVDGETAYEAVIAAYDVQAWRNNLVSLWAANIQKTSTCISIKLMFKKIRNP